MLIIPAVDLKSGECVRLSQGEMDRSTRYSRNPEEMAARWASEGARRLHIVDLDGAVEGRPCNKEAVLKIRDQVEMEIELGGGIRDMTTIEDYLRRGIDYIILGTAALKNPGLLQEATAQFPGRIIVGIDARDGMVSIDGWTEKTTVSAFDLAAGLDSAAVAAIIFTDISRDGMLTGPNIESTAALACSVSIPVIASGGVSGMADVERLLETEACGVKGIIIGRALYTGDIDLKACLDRVARMASA